MKKIAAQFLCKSIAGSSGLFAKMAQMLGSSSNALAEFEAMAHAQSDEALAFEDFVKEYPQLEKLMELFTLVDEKPKVASLSQVFKVQDKSGNFWALKIKLPKIREEIDSQLKKLGLLGHFEKIRSSDKQFGIERYLKEIQFMINQELNYELERNNIEKISQLNAHRNVETPILHDIQGENFILMTYLEGGRIEDCPNKKELALDFAKLYLEQLFVDGYIQGDTNPGNYLFADKVKMLDLAHLIVVSSEQRYALYQLLVGSGDIGDSMIALGFDEKKLSLFKEKLPLIISVLTEPFQSTMAYPLREWQFKKKLDLILSHQKWSFRTAGSPEFFLMIRSFIGAINLIKKGTDKVFFKKMLADITLPPEVTQVELIKSHLADISTEGLTRDLVIEIYEGEMKKVDLTMPVKNLYLIEDMMSSSVLAEIEKEYSLDELKRQALANGLNPMTIVDLEQNNSRYLVKIV
jgi:predicted unusual protein kinase regulating ubiquinone biosynthesis (AarF/ABC1/UbiB family)